MTKLRGLFIAYAGAVGLASLLGGCATNSTCKVCGYEGVKQFNPYTTGSFIDKADDSEGLASILIDVDNTVPDEKITNKTKFEWDAIIALDREKYPLRPVGHPEKWVEGRYKDFLLGIAKEGSAEYRPTVYLTRKAYERLVTNESFRKRMSQYISLNAENVEWEILTTKDERNLYNPNEKESTIEKLTKK